MSELVLEDRPSLRRPVLLAAFTGWPDAAEAASRAVDYVQTELGAIRIGEIRPDNFYDLTSTRPKVAVRRGVLRAMEYPTSTLYAWRNPAGAGRDLLLLRASEPNLRWREYVDAVLELATLYEASAIISLGSLFDGVSHTRPTRVSAAVSQPEWRRRLARLRVTTVEYEGPGSIHTALLEACRRRAVPGTSFWGHAPVYAQVNWNARVSLALLEMVTMATDLPVDLARLRGMAVQLDALLDRLVEGDADLRLQVEEYEQRQEGATTHPSLPSTEVILSEIEQLLREQQEDSGGDEDLR